MVDRALRQGGPDDPVAEGIVLRDAVERDQGPAGAVRPDGA